MRKINFEEEIAKLAKKINEKRRFEIFSFYNTRTDVSNYIKEAKTKGWFKKGSKSKVWQKIAVLPKIVDDYFVKTYGPDYFKDKDFFIKHFPEWRVI